MDPALAALCKQTVVVRARTGSDVYGQPSFSTAASTYAARVVPGSKELRDRDGNVVMASHVAWIDTSSTISPESKVLIGASTVRYPILRSEAFPDETGAIDHVRLTLGWS